MRCCARFLPASFLADIAAVAGSNERRLLVAEVVQKALQTTGDRRGVVLDVVYAQALSLDCSSNLNPIRHRSFSESFSTFSVMSASTPLPEASRIPRAVRLIKAP